MTKRSFLALALALVMVLTCFAGCAAPTAHNHDLASGGILCLRVNPEIAIHYNADGKVTRVEARNDDGHDITANYTGYEGAEVHEVVVELVTAIGEAGYFLEELEGQRHQITLEIEPGSQMPSDTFLNEVASAVQDCVNNNSWTTPVEIHNHENEHVHNQARSCTNPYCKDNDCDDLICDAGICTNPYCDETDCDDADCDDNVPRETRPQTETEPQNETTPQNETVPQEHNHNHRKEERTCTNPYCKDDDCDDVICDAGICTNPYCDDADCDDADCDDNIPRETQKKEDKDVRTCTNPNCKDDDCDDRNCDAGICTNPYCDERDCDDADCDENVPGRDD